MMLTQDVMETEARIFYHVDGPRQHIRGGPVDRSTRRPAKVSG